MAIIEIGRDVMLSPFIASPNVLLIPPQPVMVIPTPSAENDNSPKVCDLYQVFKEGISGLLYFFIKDSVIEYIGVTKAPIIPVPDLIPATPTIEYLPVPMTHTLEEAKSEVEEPDSMTWADLANAIEFK